MLVNIKQYGLHFRSAKYLPTKKPAFGLSLFKYAYIGQAQTKAGRLFMEAIYSDENSINRHITLDPCYALIKDHLTKWTPLIYYKKNPYSKKNIYTNADEVVSHNDRRKLQPNNKRFVDSSQQ